MARQWQLVFLFEKGNTMDIRTNLGRMALACGVAVTAAADPAALGVQDLVIISVKAPGMPDVIHNHLPLEPFIGGGLFLQKNVAREVVELGDSVQYTLRVQSPNGAASNVVSSRVDSACLSPTACPAH